MDKRDIMDNENIIKTYIGHMYIQLWKEIAIKVRLKRGKTFLYFRKLNILFGTEVINY